MTDKDMLPVIVVMAVLGVIGAIGNTLSIVFFSRCSRSSTVIFILCLSSCDLLVCVLIIPKVIELSMIANNKHSSVCKTMHFFANWAIFSSCTCVLVIALDRHRKICKAFQKQLTLKASRTVAVVSFVAALILSTKTFFLTDTVPVKLLDPLKNITYIGHYCTTSTKYRTASIVFDIVDLVFGFGGWIILALTYSQIIMQLFALQRKRKERFKAHRICSHNSMRQNSRASQKSLEQNNTEYIQRITINMRKIPGRETLKFRVKSRSMPRKSVLKRSFSEHDIVDVIDEEAVDEIPEPAASSDIEEWVRRSNSEGDLLKIGTQPKVNTTQRSAGKTLTHSGSDSSMTSISWSVPTDVDQHLTLNTRRRRKRRAKRVASAKENRLTFMLLAVSVLIIITFAPYLVIKLVMRQLLRVGAEFEIQISVQFAFSLVYLNSVFTPVVYFIFNSDFRKFVVCRGDKQHDVSSFYPNYVQ